MFRTVFCTLLYYIVLQVAAAIFMFFSGFDFTFPNPMAGGEHGYYFLYGCLQLVVFWLTAIMLLQVGREYRRHN